jgi:hypothetical protein
MSCRCRILMGLALLLSLSQGGQVRAHELRVVYDVMPGRQIQVYCFYNSVLIKGQTPARRAEVVISREGRDPIKGTTDDEGKFTFTYDRAEGMTIVAYQVDHVSQKVTIEANELEGNLDQDSQESAGSRSVSTSSPAASSGRLEEKAEQAGRQLLKDALVALCLIFIIATFIMTMRNARQLREIRKLLDEREIANREEVDQVARTS